MRLLGLGFLLVVSTTILSACSVGGDKSSGDLSLVTYSTVSDLEMTDSEIETMLADITPKIFYRDIAYLSGIMPDIEGVDKGAWLDQHVAPLFLNMGPAQLEDTPVFTTRSYMTTGSLPRMDVNGYYEITVGGTLFFSYGFLYQGDEWKWSSFSYDIANEVDAEDYADLKDFFSSSLETIHQGFGSGNLTGTFALLDHAQRSGASLEKYVTDFAYIHDAIDSSPEVFSSLDVETLQLTEFDLVRTDDAAHDELFLVHGNLLTVDGAYLLVTLGLLPQSDGSYRLYDLLQYDRHVKS